MNKIEELAEKVGITFKPMVIDGQEYQYNHVKLNEYKADCADEKEIIMKFAESIILECAAIAKKSQDFYDQHNDSVVNSDISVLIKHHFDVK